MPKKLTPYQWKNMLFSYEVIHNALKADSPDLETTYALNVIHYDLRTRAGGADGSEATEETDRASESGEDERGVVAGAGD